MEDILVHQKFEKNTEIDSSDPLLTIQANDKEGQVPSLISYLNNYQDTHSDIISIKTTDRLVITKISTIILAEIQESELLIYTNSGVVKTRETLHNLYQRLGDSRFVQVSKHGILNLDYLTSLEDSFSGNMTAILKNNVKTDVSRRYVKILMERLNI
ncbi:LytTR family DNA-binding domain-containing protein [Companilactobacillus kedongensis]|uniref:LytTR family DNA-binding domain-containing protein n=1 Tax=Companilactobacillus kedongensis TaxID=2486004 RepID=UPI001CDD240F|nr:LytTR family DNA-binding domain-containing protein [Companilactobacillus kedongensis]